jgi:hypothetical protein
VNRSFGSTVLEESESGGELRVRCLYRYTDRVCAGTDAEATFEEVYEILFRRPTRLEGLLAEGELEVVGVREISRGYS